MLVLVLLLRLLRQVSKTHPLPQQNTILPKDRNAYKNVLLRGLTSLLNLVKTKASSAAKLPPVLVLVLLVLLPVLLLLLLVLVLVLALLLPLSL